MAERLSPIQEEPRFIETIGRTGRVGILEDDTCAVGWQQPGPDRKIIWHKHSDVWRVFRQNGRVIKCFLGVPLTSDEAREARSDPNFGVTLDMLPVIVGEIGKATDLARDIQTLMTLSASERTPAQTLVKWLTSIRKELSPYVRSETKVRARGRLTEAITSEFIPQIQDASMEAYFAFLARSSEGMGIVASLFRRGEDLVNWADERESELGRLLNAVGAALVEIRNARNLGRPVSDISIEAWMNSFFGPRSVLLPVLSIRGNPYAQIAKRREINQLLTIREAIEERDIAFIERRLGNAYFVLDQARHDREDREASGLLDRYRTRGRIAH